MIPIKPATNKILRALSNPHFLLCFGLAWMLTNGWCYLFILLGSLLGISWMSVAGAAYAGLLWLPFTPEKLLTLVIALFLLRLIYPDDERTLMALKRESEIIKARFRAGFSAKEE